MSVKDKVVIITGASSGIGAATAKRLAAGGAKLALIARHEEALDQLKNELPAADVLTFATDVTDPVGLQKAVDVTKAKFGRVDVLFNNAGIMPLSPLSEARRDDWQKLVDVNIMGVLNGIAAVLPTMHEQGSGHILATSSTAGHKVFPTFAVYSGTKFAVRAIMDGLRQEEAANHIKSTIITPGTVTTNLYKTIPGKDAQAAEASLHDNPNRSLTADDVAQQVVRAIDTPANVSVSEINVRPIEQEA